MKKVFCLFSVCWMIGLAFPMSGNAAIYYVNAAAAGTNNGTSWADAYTDLQSALTDRAVVSGDEIWVAKGTYSPTAGTDRTISFQLKPGVKVYGHFSGNETIVSQRDLTNQANATILSGDIGKPGDNSDNSHHIVVADAAVSGNFNSNTILDGFTISGGNAGYYAIPDRGSGFYCNGSSAGKICSPALNNIILSGNRGYSSGAMFNNGWFGGNSSPVLTNVLFIGNSTDGSGGAMYNSGAIDRGISSPVLINVTFSGNSAQYGGAISNSGVSNGISSPVLKNVILWGNRATADGSQISNYFAAPVIAYSLIQGGINGSGIDNYASSVTDGGGNIDADPLFVNPVPATSAPTTAGDYHLQAGSPAINAGDNGAVFGVITDLDGKLRVLDGTVDIGAYEKPIPVTDAAGGCFINSAAQK